jgi:hypothetical protein
LDAFPNPKEVAVVANLLRVWILPGLFLWVQTLKLVSPIDFLAAVVVGCPEEVPIVHLNYPNWYPPDLAILAVRYLPHEEYWVSAFHTLDNPTADRCLNLRILVYHYQKQLLGMNQ